MIARKTIARREALMIDDLDRMTDDEIRTCIKTMSSGNPDRIDAELLLGARSSARQLETADKLVTTTEKLVTVTANLATATRRMMVATWALVVLTALVALATAWPFIREIGR